MQATVLLWTLSAWVWAGSAPKPVQLRLDFAASPKTVVAPAHMPVPVASALRGGDAIGFYAAALQTEYQPPAGDEVQQRLLREGAEREAADRALPQLMAAARRATKIDYEEFGRMVDLTPRLSPSPFKDIEPKRRILAASGYDHLTGPGKKRIPLSLADDVRVGRAFANVLKTYRRRQ